MVDKLFEKEYLYTSGDGGYLSTTSALCNTRKYHGLYVRPIEAMGYERYVLLSYLDEYITTQNGYYELFTHHYIEDTIPKGYKNIIETDNYPSVTFKIEDVEIKKEMLISQTEKNLLVKYTFVGVSEPITIEVSPIFAFRPIHSLGENRDYSNSVGRIEGGICYSPYSYLQPVYIQANRNCHFVENVRRISDFFYPIEQERGYQSVESLITAGHFRILVSEDSSFILSCSLNQMDVDILDDLFNNEKKRIPDGNNVIDRLHFAASQFMMRGCGKAGMIAGYPWFGTWSRDTFISLPFLYLTRGHIAEFERVIDVLIEDMKGGLFSNTGNSYNSVDAPLWFFYSMEHLETYQGWEYIHKKYYNTMLSILNNYKDGIEGVVRMHPTCLLETTGSSALTWMDTIVDSKPATPRLPIQVEINALWYNAIAYTSSIAARAHDTEVLTKWEDILEILRRSFRKGFWIEESSSLADSINILDDETAEIVRDLSIRPNQIFATSLKFIPLNKSEVSGVVDMVRNELLTPYGIRTLSQKDIKYIGRYSGNQEERDMAYHNGTAWVWLLSHYVEGEFVANGDHFLPQAEDIFAELSTQLDVYGIGSLAEIYDGDYPYEAKGAIAQAWSVAAALHIAKLIEGRIFY